MARVIEKEQKKEEIKEKSKTLAAVLLILFALAILALIVVIIVLQIRGNNEEVEEEKTYDPTYVSTDTYTVTDITKSDLNELLDADLRSKLFNKTVYVLVYSPNYDLYKTDDSPAEGGTESFQKAVTTALTNSESLADVSFYILNILSTDNKNDDSTVFSDYGITCPKGYALLVIESGKDLVINTKLSEVMECLEAIK